MPSLTSNQVLDLFRRVGALLEGHFKLSSGLHSPGYLQSALVLQHPREAETLGAALAEAARPLKPDVVMSPALGGIVIGQEVARALDVPAIFAERADGTLTLRTVMAINDASGPLLLSMPTRTRRANASATASTASFGSQANAQIARSSLALRRRSSQVEIWSTISVLV